MSGPDDFDAVRADPDPISRGRRATALMSLYQQRATELARLRREAIEQAHAEQEMTYSEIANALGITKGRITQIRSGAPARERAFFGVGPVAVGVPLREGTDTRMRSYVDATDLTSQSEAATLLGTLSLAAEPVTIAPDQQEPPTGDTIVICGPKSAPVGAELLDSDPALGMVRESDRWWIAVRETGERLGSPLGDSPPAEADLGYLSRRRDGGRVVVHVAGIHSPGSLGVLHYLAGNLRSLHRTVGERDFSLVVRCDLDGPRIADSALVSGPHFW
ncbi:sigma factor-like helix-turn-helix DNA-binding protein [Pseudonocardia nematodicida]|uniref:Sigma factor-like helix-turn-helix DNA-binding protein n=1 Tax=Pseudonocardia nematodicida TaxID=1206997 RepID=A0ABV1K8W0_9PSEU